MKLLMRKIAFCLIYAALWPVAWIAIPLVYLMEERHWWMEDVIHYYAPWRGR